MHETSWQIEFRLREGDQAAFRAVMDRYRIGHGGGATSTHGYLWTTSDDGRHAVIAKAADRTSSPTVTWSADWPTARAAFAQIDAGFTADLLAVAEPVNLVTYGDDETDAADDTVVDVASVARRHGRARLPAKRKVVVHGQAGLRMANG